MLLSLKKLPKHRKVLSWDLTSRWEYADANIAKTTTAIKQPTIEGPLRTFNTSSS